jgi:hypothetical protein
MEENLAWAGHVACMEDMRKSFNTSVRIPEGKRHLGRRRHRLEDNIKDILKIGYECADGFMWFGIGSNGGIL